MKKYTEEALSEMFAKLRGLEGVYDICDDMGYDYSEESAVPFDFWFIDDDNGNKIYDNTLGRLSFFGDSYIDTYDSVDEDEQPDYVDDDGIQRFHCACYIDNDDDFNELCQVLQDYIATLDT